jgi:heat shock protein HtpX
MLINQCKTFLLLAAMSALLLLAGSALGGSTGLTIAFIFAVLMNIFAYFYSDKIVLSMYGAQPLPRHEYGWIHDIVQELAHNMDIPMPKLWIIDTPMANAFATGRNPQHASVVVTTGILHVINAKELRGVLAHELSHVKNYDILISTIAATIATAISYLGNMAYYAAIFGRYDDREKRSNPLASLLVIIFLPIAATLMQLAVSRSREYLADETGAHYSQDPMALASALEKLHLQAHYVHMDANRDANKASTATLFIVNPFSAQGLINLFSTHPPMAERIKRLRQMHQNMFK